MPILWQSMNHEPFIDNLLIFKNIIYFTLSALVQIQVWRGMNECTQERNLSPADSVAR